jgi:hypothetical protein
VSFVPAEGFRPAPRRRALHRAGEVTPTTIAKAYRLRRILNVAVEAGYLPRNPCMVKGTGTERAAEMRHTSIPQLHQLAGYGGLRWLGCVVAMSTWPALVSRWSSRRPRSPARSS